ncbi:hypothetical protein PG989_005625 [Apiospora arundinis]
MVDAHGDDSLAFVITPNCITPEWGTDATSYRRFYVIGSRARGNAKARKTVRIPNYATHVTGDPDVAFARFLQNQQNLSAGTTNSTESRNYTITPYVFQSTIYPSDRAADLKAWLSSLIHSQHHGWLRVHIDPVSWRDVQMADSFGDPTCGYATFTNWFYSILKFHKSVNTLMGLFYTIDTDWTDSAQTGNAGRHPWIAIYRPVNPHHFEKGRSGGSSLRGPPPLLPMQRRLIEFVREEAPKRFAEHSLSKVWIGDFPIPPTPEPSHPIDGDHQGKSQCRNQLYDDAFQARKVDHRALTLDYQYQPTLEWYHNLKEEGRSYNYVNVDSWDKALDNLMGRRS